MVNKLRSNSMVLARPRQRFEHQLGYFREAVRRGSLDKDASFLLTAQTIDLILEATGTGQFSITRDLT